MMQTSTRSSLASLVGLERAGLRDEGLAVLRGVTGGLMTGHGAQKLFGAFSGPGLKGTAGFMEHLGLQPGRLWGAAAALSEFGGGALTTLGFLYPLGSIATISSMTMATAKAHWGKPIWVSEGGAETPLINIAVSVALALTGPGKYSLDEALGVRLPKWVVAAALIGAGVGVGYGILTQPAPAQQTPSETAAEAPATPGSPEKASVGPASDELASASPVS
jgi:putative oxidoreductase